MVRDRVQEESGIGQAHCGDNLAGRVEKPYSVSLDNDWSWTKRPAGWPAIAPGRDSRPSAGIRSSRAQRRIVPGVSLVDQCVGVLPDPLSQLAAQLRPSQPPLASDVAPSQTI